MSRIDDLGLARIRLSQAKNLSYEGIVMQAEQNVYDAVQLLRYAGRDDIAERLELAAKGGICRSEARTELREAMQLIDADILTTLDEQPIETVFKTREVTRA